eukprot:Gregarina_sp_Poly_1__11519@NODE_999_length_5423_cov_682_617625_g701_i0_p1_GENE_NODE_999_length_5423_cov_682_617625_g701_i0NODE_999_length_5423_cov_682_617625_g701_i0_p1_ORF_typecomplete_len348_score28_34TspO_MBR/PF03073_15/5_4e05TspO_MBR/PF03073_15/1_8e04CcmF_C/PF16327_5/0_0024CcmF_C/PF16327_5/1e04_NODE_999_length_5423_cov_682_617625_g701_i09982041
MSADRMTRGNELINREETALTNTADTPCTCGMAIIPILNFIAFFLNFVFADVGHVSDKYDTILTPPHWAFLIWIPIYVMEFLFVIYQLFYPRPRSSRLIQTLISLPFIFHQVLTAVWLIMFSREKIYEATGVLTGIWFLALIIFSLLTREFRSGKYKNYGAADYFLIEMPFALLLGWETMGLLISWSVFLIKLGADDIISKSHLVSVQLTAFIISIGLLILAAVLFAGLPILMDPFVHIPIVWGLITLGLRWYRRADSYIAHLAWATSEIQLGAALSGWIAAGIVGVFHIVAAFILISSRLCIPELERAESSTSAASSGSVSSSSSESLGHRSPRTARSALSAERAV